MSMSWTVEGDIATAGIRGGATGFQSGGVTAKSATERGERWKPKTFPPSRPSTSTSAGASNAGNSKQAGSKWIKAIEMCTLRPNGDVVQVSEHPVTLDETTASVTAIQEKLSLEAFGGAKVRLLNSKNILLADVEGTRGSKFWRTSKIIRAVSEVRYLRLEVLCGGAAGFSGANNKPPRKPSPVVHILSDSDSDDPNDFRPLGRYRKRPARTDSPLSDPDLPPVVFPEPPAKRQALPRDLALLAEIKSSIDSYHDTVLAMQQAPGLQRMQQAPALQRKPVNLPDLLTSFQCIICTELFGNDHESVVPCRDLPGLPTAVGRFVLWNLSSLQGAAGGG